MVEGSQKIKQKAVPKIVRTWMRQNTDVKLSSLCANQLTSFYTVLESQNYRFGRT
jgi:hypothetical protein